MIITSRADFAAAQKVADRALDALFRGLAQQLRGILAAAAGSGRTIPDADVDTVLAQVAAAVEQQFVVRQRATDSVAEREYLEGLIATAREQLNSADSKNGRTQAQARVNMLGERLRLLTSAGLVMVSFRGTEALTPYARIVTTAAESVTRAAVEQHAASMIRLMDGAEQAQLRLRMARTISPRLSAFLRESGSVIDWLDERGYRLSDRIWRAGHITRARIDDLLRGGIARGQSAVSLADDLERFLLPSRQRILTATPYPAPYGYSGSFDARRLARSETTRAHGVAQYVGGILNPFVVRARWHLSAQHNPKNCDGSCDAIYAQDQAQDGFEPEDVPIQVVDTHPQCTCYTTHETLSPSEAREYLRDEMLVTGVAAQPAPITPLATDVLTGLLLWGFFGYVTSTGMAE